MALQVASAMCDLHQFLCRCLIHTGLFRNDLDFDFFFGIVEVETRITSYNVCYTKLLRIAAHPDFQLVISYNPGYQSLMKDLKQSTKQRFGGLDFDYPEEKMEIQIVAKVV